MNSIFYVITAINLSSKHWQYPITNYCSSSLFSQSTQTIIRTWIQIYFVLSFQPNIIVVNLYVAMVTFTCCVLLFWTNFIPYIGCVRPLQNCQKRKAAYKWKNLGFRRIPSRIYYNSSNSSIYFVNRYCWLLAFRRHHSATLWSTCRSPGRVCGRTAVFALMWREDCGSHHWPRPSSSWPNSWSSPPAMGLCICPCLQSSLYLLVRCSGPYGRIPFQVTWSGTLI